MNEFLEKKKAIFSHVLKSIRVGGMSVLEAFF